MKTNLRIILALIIYLLTTGLVTLYYGFNFYNFVHRKGDELFYFALFLMITSTILQVLISQTTGVLSLKFALLSPLANGILSFILGFVFWDLTELEGIPRHLIFIYGGCYLLILCLLIIAKVVAYHKSE
jgi:hypothetical protein